MCFENPSGGQDCGGGAQGRRGWKPEMNRLEFDSMVRAWLQGLGGREVSGTEPHLQLGDGMEGGVTPDMGLGRSSMYGG